MPITWFYKKKNLFFDAFKRVEMANLISDPAHYVRHVKTYFDENFLDELGK